MKLKFFFENQFFHQQIFLSLSIWWFVQENNLKEVNTNYVALRKNHLELTEYKSMLKKTEIFLSESRFNFPDADEGTSKLNYRSAEGRPLFKSRVSFLGSIHLRIIWFKNHKTEREFKETTFNNIFLTKILVSTKLPFLIHETGFRNWVSLRYSKIEYSKSSKIYVHTVYGGNSKIFSLFYRL